MADRAILYNTEFCHLCEEAEALLRGFPAVFHKLEFIDIALDDELFEQYGTHIPVFCYKGEALFWPFDREALSTLIEE